MKRHIRAGLGPALVLFAFTLNCRPRQSLETIYARAEALKAGGKLSAAMAEASRGLSGSRRNSIQFWKFYLLKAELIQQVSGGRAALDLLGSDMPFGREFASLNAKRKLDRSFAYFSLARYPESLKELDDAYEFARIAEDESYLSAMETFRAQILIRSQHPDTADAHLREGARHAVLSKNKAREAYNLQIVAQLAMLQSRYEDAIRAIEAQLDILKRGKSSASLPPALIDLAICNYKLGRLDEALELYERAGQLAKDSGDRRNEQIALGNEGVVYLERRDYDRAKKFFEEALQGSIQMESGATRATWLNNLAQVAIETKHWKEAAAYNEQALNLKRKLKIPTGELYSLVNYASILLGEGKVEEAEKVFTQVAQKPSDDPLPSLDAHFGLAQLYATAGQDAKADREFGAALNVVERTRSTLQQDQSKIDFLAKMMVVHHKYVDFLMSRGRTERALEVAEASRARILQERLGAQSGETPLVNAAAYRRLARESGAILVSYFIGVDRSYVWLTTPRQVISYTLPSEQILRTYVENYRALIENLHDPLDVEDANGRELYSSLLDPIAGRIPPGASVIIVPDGVLNALNFETLPVASPKPHFFIDDATISVVPSLNLLANARFKGQSSGRLLLIGNPEQVEEKYQQLPYAEEEITAVESHFRSDRVDSFRQKQASPSAYLQATRGAFSFVHFTAHASADPAVPLNSAIILSGQRGSNELTARDVLGRSVDAGLVTISACRGAGAKTYAGEGLVGFMWAFFHAGAHGIIAGLWDVSDESTPRLMDQLYSGLTHGENPAQALRNAKLALRKSSDVYKLPYYWGPFQLYLRDIAYVRDGSPGRSAPLNRLAGVKPKPRAGGAD